MQPNNDLLPTSDHFERLPFPPERQVIVDAGRMGSKRHVVHGLLEFDVTHARRSIAAHEAHTGEKLSFTAFIVECLAQAIQSHPNVNAYRNWRNQLIVFQDVDVVTMIEAEKGSVAIPHIIRGANRKTLYEIHAEIRGVQTRPSQSEQRSGGLANLGNRVPRFARDLFFWAARRNPHWIKKYMGTVVLTSVGMFFQGSGWGVGFLPVHTLGLTLGGIAKKPDVRDGEIVIREKLSLTISTDHDIVDGAPAARFARSLKELIESGYGLENEA
jgi:pyruvate/2-oxoglutarate dehydrogenase complex dihydrolipoamide acyltransferase (E2) component